MYEVLNRFREYVYISIYISIYLYMYIYIYLYIYVYIYIDKYMYVSSGFCKSTNTIATRQRAA